MTEIGKDVERFFSRIDIMSILGENRFLGVDLTESRAHVVELEKKSKLLDRYSASFDVRCKATCYFAPEMNARDRGHKVAEALSSAGIVTRKAVATIRTAGLRETTATIPSGVEDLDEWVGENAAKIVKVPLDMQDIVFELVPLEESPQGLRSEIVFVRRSELDALLSTLLFAGLEVAGVSAGTRDAALLLPFCNGAEHESAFTILFAEDELLELQVFRNGSRVHQERVHSPASSSRLPTLRNDDSSSVAHVYACGDQTGLLNLEDVVPLCPFELSPQYAVAAGLAIRGFFPELAPLEFLESRVMRSRQLTLQKRLSQRIVLGLAIFAVMVVGIPTVISSILSWRLETAEKDFAGRDSAYVLYRGLEERVCFLEQLTSERVNAGGRTEDARLLHGIAASTPAGVRLSELTIWRDGIGRKSIDIRGEGKGSEPIAEYLRKLIVDGPCIEAKLERVGRQGGARARSPGSTVVDFQISAISR